jgi:ElaA protein
VENNTKKGQIFLFRPLAVSGINESIEKTAKINRGHGTCRPDLAGRNRTIIRSVTTGSNHQKRPCRSGILNFAAGGFSPAPEPMAEAGFALSWSLKTFAELTPGELHDMLRLRQQVFVVEQRCIYLDCDGIDTACRHLAGWHGGRLAAYARIVPPGVKYAEPSIGRVATAPEFRKRGLGRQLMARALEAIHERFGPVPVQIGAQAYLQKFYAQFGFEPGEPYMEDGIPHVHMLRMAG